VNIAPEGTFGAGVAEVGVLDLLKVGVTVLITSILAENYSYSLLILRLVKTHFAGFNVNLTFDLQAKHGRLTTEIHTIRTTLTSSIPFRPYTMSQRTRFYLPCYS